MKTCARCGCNLSSSYAIDANNDKFCYMCCADLDKEQMRVYGQIALYLTSKFVHNWSVSLKIPVSRYEIDNKNNANQRIDVWFMFEDTEWHGVQHGISSELCYCKRLNT